MPNIRDLSFVQLTVLINCCLTTNIKNKNILATYKIHKSKLSFNFCIRICS